jgi:hypothetical protein
LNLEHFLSQHGDDLCLLSETFLNATQAFRFVNYVCHRTDRPTAGGGTDILVRRGIVHHSVPVPGLTRLEATAVQVTLTPTPDAYAKGGRGRQDSRDHLPLWPSRLNESLSALISRTPFRYD